MDRQPQSSEFKINAIQMGVSLRPGAATLELGERHPIARSWRACSLWRRPIQYQYMARFEGILYGTEHLSLPLIDRVATQFAVHPPAGVAADATAGAPAQPA